MSDIDALADTVGKGLVDYFIHEEAIDALDSLVAIAKNAEGALALADEIIAPISAASEEVANKILAFRAAFAIPVQGDTE